MKVLEITKSIEGILQYIYDVALRAGGIQLHPLVKQMGDRTRALEGEGQNRHLTITEDIDKGLHTLCDIVLKSAGIQAHKHVQTLIESIIDKE